MEYLKTYGKRRFQAGGEAPAPAPAEGGGGGGEGEQILALAQAAAQGDPQAAQELGFFLAPMILEQAGAGGGGAAPAPAPAPGGEEPVFRKGGEFLRKR